MKKALLLVLVASGLLWLATSCNRADNISLNTEPLNSYIENIGLPVYYIKRDSLFRANTIEKELIYLSPTGSTLTHPRINNQKNKVAFIDMNGNIPVIIDMEGNLIEKVSSADKASEICWSPDGNSLVIIRDFSGSISPPFDQRMTVWGAPYTPPFDRSVLDDPETYLDVLSISTENFAAWGVSKPRSPGSTQTVGAVYRDGPLGQLVIESTNIGNKPRSLSFHPDNHDLWVSFAAKVSPSQSWYNARYPIEATKIDEYTPFSTSSGSDIRKFNGDGTLVLLVNNRQNNNGLYLNRLQIGTDSSLHWVWYYQNADDFPLEADIK
jgi:hypothetical protein